MTKNDFEKIIYITAKYNEEPTFTTRYICKSNRTVKKFINDVLSDKVYNPKKGDKIYIYTGCNIPRFKLKTFCENTGVALVKFAEKANFKFIGNETIEDLTNGTNTFYEKDELLKFLFKKSNSSKLVKIIQDSTANYVEFDYYARDYFKILDLDSIDYEDEPKFAINEDDFNKLIDIIEDPSIYNQDEILKKINSGTIMTREYYKSVNRFFESSDDENIKLGMEAIANCDFEKSAVYLLMLIEKYGNKIKDSSTRNHINFKSFIKFFDIKDLGRFNLNCIIKCLIDRNLLNKSNLDELRPNILDELDVPRCSKYFTNSDYIVSDVITEALKNNILDKVLDTEIIDDDTEELNIKIINYDRAIIADRYTA